MTRREQIEEAAKAWADKEYGNNGSSEYDDAFMRGAEWADANRSDVNATEIFKIQANQLALTQKQLECAVGALRFLRENTGIGTVGEPQLHWLYGEKCKEALAQIEELGKK